MKPPATSLRPRRRKGLEQHASADGWAILPIRRTIVEGHVCAESKRTEVVHWKPTSTHEQIVVFQQTEGDEEHYVFTHYRTRTVGI